MKRFLILLALASPAAAEQSFEAYAAQCAAQIAEIPEINCGEGVLIPITVNGAIPATYTKDMTCDRPGLLPNGAGSDGQCVPGSRLLDLSTETIQITAMCRQKTIRIPFDALVFNEVDIIAHNPATGATCWYQAEAPKGTSINGMLVPSPNAPGAADFWNPIEEVVKADCGGCHDNDAIMYSPFIGQVWEEIATNPLGLYYHVAPEMGFGAWPTTSLQPRDNACLGCHRIGIQSTCGFLLEQATGQAPIDGADEWASTFPGNTFMPPLHGQTQTAWNTIFQGSVKDLQSCCSNPEQAFCNMTPILGAAE
ncbi:MAG: hypothetical protein COB08_007750 [Rhodobacteraceae bacterium]|nr:hypothetical protein [Paracoccaceae bacterium]